MILYRGPKVQGIKRLGLNAGLINLAFGDDPPFVYNIKNDKEKQKQHHTSQARSRENTCTTPVWLQHDQVARKTVSPSPGSR